MPTAQNRDMNLPNEVLESTGVNVFSCMQCMRCSAGCPMAEEYDKLPHEIVRSVQEGDTSVRNCKSIWLCASCQTCNSRCPQSIDIPSVIDHFRQQNKNHASVPEVARFYDTFMRNANRFGRIYEMGMMGELNLKEKTPFKDFGMGMRMIRKGKIKLFPKVVRQPRDVERREVKDNQIAYYPGCSLHSTGKGFDLSFRGVCKALDVDLVEIEGWTCCGTTPAHSTDEEASVAMPISNLALAERAGFESVASPCAACYSRFKAAQGRYRNSMDIAEKVDSTIGYGFGDNVEVLNAAEVMGKMAGERFEERVKNPLGGLKVACYYGCLLTRPPDDTGVDDFENPTAMEGIVRAAGGLPVDWGRKTDCCGGSLSVTHTEVAKDMTAAILSEAKARGADMIAVACPLCQVNLDERQPEMAEKMGFTIPVVYITQLMAYALGLGTKEKALGLSAIPPSQLMAT